MTVHSSRHSPAQIILIFLVGGPALVLYGLKRLFLLREIENTPTSKIRSAAVGKVELSGLARMRKPLKSPITQLDCCWWLCRVQELRSNGKNSHWATIKSMGSLDIFFLQDPTGQVMVNPMGAELSVLNSTFELNAMNRTKIAPVLQSWGVGDTNWFGLNKKMRVLEECLPDCAPVYVLGEIAPVKDHLADRDGRFRARLRHVKEDAEQMKGADTNQDGTVDAQEWDAMLHKQEEQFLKEELARQSQEPQEEAMLVRAPQSGTYLISTGTQSEVTRRYRWATPLSLLGGLLMSAGGVYWAIQEQWAALVIVGCVGIGFVLSLALTRKGVTVWSLLLP